MGDMLFDGKEHGRFNTLDKVIDDFMKTNAFFSDSYTKFVEKDIDTAHIREILNTAEKFNELILSSSIETNKQITDFNDNLAKFKSTYNKMVSNNIKMLHEFGVSTQILSSISTESRQFSTDMIKDIFDEFDKISKKSMESVQYTEDTMNSFINDTSKESLSYILRETKFFITKFNDFYASIINLKSVSDNFMQKTLISLNEIQKIAGSIKDISEKIKLISINVRIEAAHLDSKNSGFQVLGNEINNFADLTSKIISNANYEIDKTIKNIDSIKDDYENRMNEVVRFIPDLQNTITPFESIIGISLAKIKDTIKELYGVSNNINNSIKFIVDKFQYQDITTQEGRNIILYINNLSQRFEKITSDLNIANSLSQPEKFEINKDILNNFLSIITTQKEREIIENYAKQLNIELEKKYDVKEVESFKKVDESIVLF